MLENYRILEARLRAIRTSPEAKELTDVYGLDLEPEEDAILDQMDEEWDTLTDEERDLLRSEGPTCW